jgi:transcriptional regulator with XRE-family HTH domain
VSRSIDPSLRAYLRHRIQEWLAVDGRTARELARLAGVSAAQISDAVNDGSIGWKTMMGLLPAFGLTLGTLETAALQWAAARPVGDVAAPIRRGSAQKLHDRPEWSAVAAAALEEHGELDPEDVAAVGHIGDDTAIFVGALDVPTVAGLAAVLGARRQRLARRRL